MDCFMIDCEGGPLSELKLIKVGYRGLFIKMGINKMFNVTDWEKFCLDFSLLCAIHI